MNGTTQQAAWARAMQRFDDFVCRYWIPFGFAVFLSGFFWAPSRHNYIVIVTLALLLPALLAAWSPRRWRDAMTASPVLPLAALFLVYMSGNAIVQRGMEFNEFFKWSAYILLFIFAVGVAQRLSERQLAQVLGFGAVAACAGGLCMIWIDWQAGQLWLPEYRLIGHRALYNALRSGFLFGAFALVAGWFIGQWEQPYSLRVLAALAALLCVLLTLLTGSRAPMLGLLAAAAWQTVSGRRWDRLLLIVVATAVLGYLGWDRLSERGVSLRPEIWQYVWDLCKQKPWFGDGLVRYPLEVPTTDGPRYNTHNLFLTMLYYGGAVGVALFVALAGATLFLSWRDRRESGASLLAALLQIFGLVAMQFDGPNLITRPADFWVLLWLPIALHLYGRRQIRERRGAQCTAR